MENDYRVQTEKQTDWQNTKKTYRKFVIALSGFVYLAFMQV